MRNLSNILLFLLFINHLAIASESVGTVLGDVTHNSAKLWIHAESNSEITVKLSPESDATVRVQKSDFSESSHFMYIEGLAANTAYQYTISIDGEVSPMSSGKFTSSPMPGKPSKFSIAVISCLKRTKADWTILTKEKPDYLFMLGDNIYTHKSKRDNFDTMRNLYLGFRKNKDFASLVKNRPTLAIWDDHDMGPNNSDGTLEGKEDSLKSFMDAWPNSSYGIENAPGVFYTKQHGDVDFFMLDVRYYRQPQTTKEARMLGDEQFNWLVKNLQSSKAVFKVIASGSPIDNTKLKDGWKNWPWARQRLYDAISENKITGVIFLGGDLHFADLAKISPEKTGIPYPIYNIVSSGFTDNKSRPGWNYTSQKNPYVMLNFDTTVKDPKVEIIVKDGQQTYQSVTVNTSDLK